MFTPQAAAYLKQLENGGVSSYLSRSIETSFRRAINGIATLRGAGWEIDDIAKFCESASGIWETVDSLYDYERIHGPLRSDEALALYDIVREYWNGNTFVRKALSNGSTHTS